jgi:hypothetical protein
MAQCSSWQSKTGEERWMMGRGSWVVGCEGQSTGLVLGAVRLICHSDVGEVAGRCVRSLSLFMAVILWQGVSD